MDLKNNETSWEHKPQENTEREPLKQSILRMENFKSHHTGKSCLSGDNGKSKKNQKIKRLRIEMSFDLNEKELSWRTGRAENKSKTQTRRHNRVEPDSGRRMYQRVCLKLLKWFPPIPALLIVWTSSSEDGSSDSIPSTAASFDYISALSLLNRFLLVLLNCFLLQPHLRLHRQPHHQTLFQQHLAFLDWQAHSRTDFQNGFSNRFQTDSEQTPNSKLYSSSCPRLMQPNVIRWYMLSSSRTAPEQHPDLGRHLALFGFRSSAWPIVCRLCVSIGSNRLFASLAISGPLSVRSAPIGPIAASRTLECGRSCNF